MDEGTPGSGRVAEQAADDGEESSSGSEGAGNADAASMPVTRKTVTE